MKFDVIEYLNDNAIDYKEHGKNIWREHVGIECPKCQDDPSHHLNIKLDGASAICFRCGYRAYSAFKILKDLAGEDYLSFNDCVSIALKFPYTGEELDLEQKEQTDVDKEASVIRFNNIWSRFVSIDKTYYDIYLSKRGIQSWFYKKWNFKGGINYGKQKHAGRVIMPIRDLDGNIVNFVGRSIYEDNTLRYKNCSTDLAIVSANKCLYGLYETLQNNNKNYLIIVEGVFDAAKLLQNGANCVSLMKKDITKQQLDIVMECFPKDTIIYICLDSDANDNDWKKLINRLSLFYSDVKKLSIISGEKDMADLSNNEINMVISEVKRPVSSVLNR